MPHIPHPPHSPQPIESKQKLAALTLGALGIVYGDIGTSPLYALRECFNPAHGVPATSANVLGILSLIIWSLTIVVTIKYIVNIPIAQTTFFLSRVTYLATPRPGMQIWRVKIFVFLSRNSQRASSFFRIPSDQVIEIGLVLEI